VPVPVKKKFDRLQLWQPSETASFINHTKAHNLHILPISVQDQVVMPGLIDPHVHAIGGGGEQGMHIM
jgi:N-acetylglucosamine-6-phosphate deacetylase